MITKEQLIQNGFIDVSSDKNGLAYRKQLNSLIEICFYTYLPFLRAQTIASGFTIELKGITNIDQLNRYCEFIKGKPGIDSGKAGEALRKVLLSRRVPPPKNLPSPPPRIINTVVHHYCKHCGSSRPRSGWLGLFGKRVCPNNCIGDISDQIGPYDPSLIKGHGSFLNKSEYTNMDECKKNLYESASKANRNTCVHETPRSNILCTSCLNHNHYEEKPTQTYDCLSGNYPKATVKDFIECLFKNTFLSKFWKWLKYWFTPGREISSKDIVSDHAIKATNEMIQSIGRIGRYIESIKRIQLRQDRKSKYGKKRYSISTPITKTNK